MKLEKKFPMTAAAEAVMETMQDPKFIEHDEKIRETLEVTIKDLKKTKTEHVYEVHTVTYARGMTGVDKTKKEKNVSTVSWNLATGVGTWVFKSGSDFGEKIDIKGGHDVIKKGDGSELKMWVDINISVPLLGGTIAKKVAAGFEKEWPRYVDRIGKWIK